MSNQDQQMQGMHRLAARCCDGSSEEQQRGQKQTAASKVSDARPKIVSGFLAGLKERASIDAMHGAVQLDVPIELPHGRHGFEPKLELKYNSHVGNGVFGVGWALSLPAIKRKTTQRIPQYGPETDIYTLYLEGRTEELVELSTYQKDEYMIVVYQSVAITQWNRIEHWQGLNTPSTDFWRVLAGDNVSSIFGSTTAARLQDGPTGKIFAWLLEERYDSLGNLERYRYRSEDTVNVVDSIHEKGRNTRTNRHLEAIFYANQDPNRDPGDWKPVSNAQVTFHFEIYFLYSQEIPLAAVERLDRGENPNERWDVRQDTFSNYKASMEIRTHRLCRSILIIHRFAELGPKAKLVRSYTFSYNERPQLSQLVRISSTAYSVEEGGLPITDNAPIVFTYEDTSSTSSLVVKHTDVYLGRANSLKWLSFEGDSKADLVARFDDGWYRRRNVSALSGSIDFESWEPICGALPSFDLHDFNNDGYTEMVKEGLGYYARSEQAWSRFASFTSIHNAEAANWNTKHFDLTGNGVADILVDEGGCFAWYETLGKDGFAGPLYVNPDLVKGRGEAPSLINTGSHRHTLLADMSGDGLQDIVLFQNGSTCYWPNLGFGHFGPRVSMSNSPIFGFADDFRSDCFVFVDVDGSGTSDLVRLRANNTLIVYINQCGNSWDTGTELPACIPQTARAHIEFVDLLSCGSKCLTFIDQLGFLAYIDLAGGRKPSRLVEVDNGKGGLQKYKYQSSTYFQLRDRNAWTLPYAIPCLHREERYDTVRQLTEYTEYNYHEGAFDQTRREFRGFCRVDISHGLQSEVSPGLFLKLWFHPGLHQYKGVQATSGTAVSMPDSCRMPSIAQEGDFVDASLSMEGVELRRETYSRGDTLLSIVENCYAVSARSDGQHRRSWQSYLIEKRTHTFEGEQQARKSQYIALSVDEYGNSTKDVNTFLGVETSAWPQQRDSAFLLTECDMSHLVSEEDDFRVPISVGSRTFEGKILGLHDFITPTDVSSAELRLVSSNRTTYRSDDLSGELPYRTMSKLARIHTKATLAFTKEQLESYGDNINAQDLSLAGYIGPSSDGSWWVHDDHVLYGEKNITVLEELYAARTNFYLPATIVDQHSRSREITYDEYRLLEVSLINEAGHVTQVEPNYCTLQHQCCTNAGGVSEYMISDVFGLEQRFHRTLGKTQLRRPSVPMKFDAEFLAQLPVTGTQLLQDASICSFADVRSIPNIRVTVQSVGSEATINYDKCAIEICFQDGFGRELQRKKYSGQQGWWTSGWIELDSRGFPSRIYEPFFDSKPTYNSTPHGLPTLVVHDALGREIRRLRPDGAWSKTSFGSWTEVAFDTGDTSSMDAASDDILAHFVEAEKYQRPTVKTVYSNTPIIRQLDVCGRIICEMHEDPDGTFQRKIHLFSTNGLLLGMRDSMDREVTNTSYDMLGRPIRSRHMDSGTELKFYRAEGDFTHIMSDGKSWLIKEFDSLDRPITLRTGQTILVRYEYEDDNDTGFGFERLKRVWDQCGLLFARDYDSSFQPTKLSRTYCKLIEGVYDWSQGPELEDTQLDTTMIYDNTGKIVQKVFPNGPTQYMTYSDQGQVESIRDLLDRVTYNEFGQEQELHYSDGSKTSNEYDFATKQLVSRSFETRNGLGIRFVYRLDATGNVDEIREEYTNSTSSTNTVLTVKYDCFGRVTSGSRSPEGSSEPMSTETWTYDQENNILTQKTQEGEVSLRYGSAGTSGLQHHPTDNLLRIVDGDTPFTVTYNGNAGSQGLPDSYRGMQLEWNLQKQLSAVQKPGVRCVYRYDYQGRRGRRVRFQQASSAAEDWRYFNGCDMCREPSRSAETSSVDVRLNGQLKGRYKYSDNSFNSMAILADHLGSPRNIFDVHGKLTSTVEFSLYGLPGQDSPPDDCGFTGHVLDRETGFYHTHHRYYDPHIGRWLSPDPAGYVDGSNRLCYVKCNPANLVDRFGLNGGPSNSDDAWQRSLDWTRDKIQRAVPQIDKGYTYPQWNEFVRGAGRRMEEEYRAAKYSTPPTNIFLTNATDAFKIHMVKLGLGFISQRSSNASPLRPLALHNLFMPKLQEGVSRRMANMSYNPELQHKIRNANTFHKLGILYHYGSQGPPPATTQPEHMGKP